MPKRKMKKKKNDKRRLSRLHRDGVPRGTFEAACFVTTPSPTSVSPSFSSIPRSTTKRKAVHTYIFTHLLTYTLTSDSDILVV